MTDSIGIRTATAADVEPWIDLYEEVAAEGVWIGGEAPVDRDARRPGFERLVDSDSAVAFFAFDGDLLVGALTLDVHGGRADLGMLVRDGYRGAGLGSRLMTRAVDWAGDHGCHKVVLEVWPHNVAARRLYERFGFVEEGVLRRQYRRRSGQLWDSVVMGLVLDETSPGSPHAP